MLPFSSTYKIHFNCCNFAVRTKIHKNCCHLRLESKNTDGLLPIESLTVCTGSRNNFSHKSLPLRSRLKVCRIHTNCCHFSASNPKLSRETIFHINCCHQGVTWTFEKIHTNIRELQRNFTKIVAIRKLWKNSHKLLLLFRGAIPHQFLYMLDP